MNIRHVYGTCIYLYLMTSEARDTNQLEAAGTLPLHSSQDRQHSFQLLHWNCLVSCWFYWAFPKHWYTQTSLAATALVSEATPTSVWSASELTGRKNDICSTTVSSEKNKCQLNLSCKASKFGRNSWKKTVARNIWRKKSCT